MLSSYTSLYMKTFNLLVAFALRRRWRFARALAYFPRSTNPEGKQGTLVVYTFSEPSKSI